MQFRLYAVRVWVTDWERALHFYTEVLGIPTDLRNDELGWAELATGGSHLAVERADPDDPESAVFVGRYVGVSLEVDDIEATYATLRERGVEFLSPPKVQPWGGVLAHLRDPDGNVLTLLGSSGSTSPEA